MSSCSRSESGGLSSQETRLTTLESLCQRMLSRLEVETEKRRELEVKLSEFEALSQNASSDYQSGQDSLSRSLSRISTEATHNTNSLKLIETQVQTLASTVTESLPTPSGNDSMKVISAQFKKLAAALQDERARRSKDLKQLVTVVQSRLDEMSKLVRKERTARQTLEHGVKQYMVVFQKEMRELVTLMQRQVLRNQAAMEEVLHQEVSLREESDKKIVSVLQQKYEATGAALVKMRADIKAGFTLLTQRLSAHEQKLGFKVGDSSLRGMAQRMAAHDTEVTKIGDAVDILESKSNLTRKAPSGILSGTNVDNLSRYSASSDKSSQHNRVSSLTVPAKRGHSRKVSVTKDPKALKPVLCENCEEAPSVQFCIECELKLCVHCNDELHKPKKFAMHTRRYVLDQMKAAQRWNRLRKSVMESRWRIWYVPMEVRSPRSRENYSFDKSERKVPKISTLGDAVNVMMAKGETKKKVQRSMTRSGDLYRFTIDDLTPQRVDDFVGKTCSVFVGQNHAGLIDTKGFVYMWGANQDFQLGIGDVQEDREIPVLIELKDASMLACGQRHNLAVTHTGQAWSWGSGMLGVLGHEKDDDKHVPTRIQCVPEDEEAVWAAVGQYNSALITTKVSTEAEENACVPPGFRFVYVWGRGQEGQLGVGKRKPGLRPSLVELFVKMRVSIQDIAFGDKHVVACTAARLVDDGKGRRKFIGNASTESKSDDDQSVSTVNGIDWSRGGICLTWGNNEFGQCGYTLSDDENDSTDDVLQPRCVASLSKLGVEVSKVACGPRHTSVLTSEGLVFSWGSGETHQIGILDNIDQFAPVLVKGISPGPVIDLSVGEAVTIAVTDNGDVWGWGWGFECATPKLLPEIQGEYVRSCQVGNNSMIAFVTGVAQELFTWSIDEEDEPKEFQALRGKRICGIGQGSAHSVAVMDSGRMLAWGENKEMQLGVGDDLEYWGPVQVKSDYLLKRVTCGYLHNVGITKDDKIVSWGSGAMGRLGHPSDSDVGVPTPIMALARHNVVAVSCGQYNSGCVTDQGLLFVWGEGTSGQLGVPGLRPSLVPVRLEVENPYYGKDVKDVPTLTDKEAKEQREPDVKSKHVRWVSVAFGNKHAIACSSEGFVYSWGNNDFGQLGYPTGVDAKVQDAPGGGDDDDEYLNEEELNLGSSAPQQNMPQLVSYITGMYVSHVQCGEFVSMFLTKCGEVFSCGSAETLQLGNGEQEDRTLPERVAALRGVYVVDVQVGNLNCVAVSDTGDVYAWGWGTSEIPALVKNLHEDEKCVRHIACGMNDILFCTQ